MIAYTNACDSCGHSMTSADDGQILCARCRPAPKSETLHTEREWEDRVEDFLSGGYAIEAVISCREFGRAVLRNTKTEAVVCVEWPGEVLR